jgi:hypothetical protein
VPWNDGFWSIPLKQLDRRYNNFCIIAIFRPPPRGSCSPALAVLPLFGIFFQPYRLLGHGQPIFRHFDFAAC